MYSRGPGNSPAHVGRCWRGIFLGEVVDPSLLWYVHYTLQVGLYQADRSVSVAGMVVIIDLLVSQLRNESLS